MIGNVAFPTIHVPSCCFIQAVSSRYTAGVADLSGGFALKNGHNGR